MMYEKNFEKLHFVGKKSLKIIFTNFTNFLFEFIIKIRKIYSKDLCQYMQI